MKGDPYPPGTVLGGMRVIKLLHEGASQNSTRYLVARTCCGERLEITHRLIYQRELAGNARCRPCRRAGVEMDRKPNGVLIPSGPMRGWWPSLSPMGFRISRRSPQSS